MLFNQLLDKPHLSGGLSWQRRNAHYQGGKQICAQNLREISFFVRMEHFRELLFLLMKRGTNTFYMLSLYFSSVQQQQAYRQQSLSKHVAILILLQC